MRKPKRKDFETLQEYRKALARWYEQMSARYLMQANDIREKYGV